MHQPFTIRVKRGRAFTLIEMLVVVTIIVLLLAFSTPALMRTMQSSRLSAAGDTLLGVISEAQQIAFAQNVPVELRFFKFQDEFKTSTGFRSYQMFKVTLVSEGTGPAATVKESLVPASNLIRIPESIVIVSDETLSPLLPGEGVTDTKEGGGTPGYSGVADAKYIAIRFMTDGSCRTVGTASGGLATLSYQTLPMSYLTLTSEGGQVITVKNLPKNFYTIQIDPFTGKARSYKPGF